MCHSGALTYCSWATDLFPLSEGLRNKPRGSWNHLLSHSQHLRAPGTQNMDTPTRICMIHIYIMSLPSFEGLSCLCLHSASRNQKTKIATKPTRIWNPVSRERSRISQAHRKQWASLPVTSETTGERSLDPSVCRLDELARLLLPHRMLGETHAVGITGASFHSKGKWE